MNTMLLISSEKYSDVLTTAESLEFGGMMILLGMGAVFAVLGIIFTVLMVFKSVFGNISTKEKTAIEKNEPAIPTSVPVSATQDTEIVAVIAAAIAMAEEECGNGAKFRVVSFKRK